MTTQPQLPLDEPVDNPEESTYTEYGSGQDTSADTIVTADTSTEQSPTVDGTLPQAEQQTPAPSLEAEKLKLAEEQARYNAQLERDRTISALENEALQMEKQLMNQGLTESDAKSRTYTHLEGRVQQIPQEQTLQHY